MTKEKIAHQADIKTSEMWFVRIADSGEIREVLIDTLDEPRAWIYGRAMTGRGVAAIGATRRQAYALALALVQPKAAA